MAPDAGTCIRCRSYAGGSPRYFRREIYKPLATIDLRNLGTADVTSSIETETIGPYCSSCYVVMIGRRR